MPFEQQLIFGHTLGRSIERDYICPARIFSRCLWRRKLNSQPGTAAAGKAALKLVVENEAGDDEALESRGMLTGLSPEERSREILSLILHELDDDKAEEVVTINLAGKSDIADAMVVASGRSQRHVAAIAEKVMRRLKEAGLGRANVEGAGIGDWVLIDAEDVIVHLFRPEVRAFYNLERVWSEAAHAPIKTDA